MKRISLAAILCAVAGTLSSASADMITNGSFEDPVVPSGTYSIFGSINGWTTSFGPGIEIQNHIAGAPYDGDQFVELDSSANSGMYQDLATVVGETYRLSFAYSPRAGIAANSTGIDVFWGGSSVTNLALSGVGHSNTVWQMYTYDLVATSTTTRLEFDATGISDSYGGYLDKVSVVAVPEPPSIALIGIGLTFAIGIAFRHKGQKRMDFTS